VSLSKIIKINLSNVLGFLYSYFYHYLVIIEEGNQQVNHVGLLLKKIKIKFKEILGEKGIRIYFSFL